MDDLYNQTDEESGIFSNTSLSGKIANWANAGSQTIANSDFGVTPATGTSKDASAFTPAQPPAAARPKVPKNTYTPTTAYSPPSPKPASYDLNAYSYAADGFSATPLVDTSRYDANMGTQTQKDAGIQQKEGINLRNWLGHPDKQPQENTIAKIMDEMGKGIYRDEQKRLATPAPDSEFSHNLHNPNDFAIPGVEKTINPRYNPNRNAPYGQHEAGNEGFAAPSYEGIKFDPGAAAMVKGALFGAQEDHIARAVPQAKVDPATAEVMQRHLYSEGISQYDNKTAEAIGQNPHVRLGAIGINGVLSGSVNIATNAMISTEPEARMHDPGWQPMNGKIPQGTPLHAASEATRKNRDYLIDHHAYREKDGNRSALGEAARLTHDISSALPGTAMAFFGGPVLRLILMGSSSNAAYQSAYDEEREALKKTGTEKILQDPANEEIYNQLLLKHQDPIKAEEALRERLAHDYAQNVRYVHAGFVATGRIIGANSNSAANTAFARFMRNLSINTLTQMAPKAVVDWWRGESGWASNKQFK